MRRLRSTASGSGLPLNLPRRPGRSICLHTNRGVRIRPPSWACEPSAISWSGTLAIPSSCSAIGSWLPQARIRCPSPTGVTMLVHVTDARYLGAHRVCCPSMTVSRARSTSQALDAGPFSNRTRRRLLRALSGRRHPDLAERRRLCAGVPVRAAAADAEAGGGVAQGRPAAPLSAAASSSRADNPRSRARTCRSASCSRWRASRPTSRS